MRTIILAMLRRPVAQGLIAELDKAAGVRAVYESDYERVTCAVSSRGADTLLIEVAEKGKYVVDYCLSLCDGVRNEAPGCRLLLLCPEQDESCVWAVLGGMGAGRIDDFLFCDASTDFLVSKLLVA